MSEQSRQSRALAVPSGRLTRMGRMGAMAAGVAGRMAVDGARQWGQGARPQTRDLLLTPANMARITNELTRMRGAAMKLGQLVSMDSGDVLPPELEAILARLRADADFMPPKQLRDVLDAEWGAGWRRRFAAFDVRPVAAASIGQVHKARLPDGTELAVKVQYPGIAQSIDSDVANLGLLVRMSGLLPKGFELAPYLEEARKQLHEEADYAAEAAHLNAFRALLDQDSDVLLPQIAQDLSTPRVLAMTFAHSDPIETLSAAPQGERDHAAQVLCALMLREVFEFGLMQTDPNFANYRYAPEAQRIVLLDFGATRGLPKALVADMRALLSAGMAGDADAVSEITARIGLVPHSIPDTFRRRILGMIDEVFQEVRAAPVLDLAASDLSRRLQQQGEALARDGFVPPPVPIDLLFVQRKVAGMFLLAARLGARVPVQKLLEPYVT
ncbi:MAG: AarF/ABC1/UbiB kinase family protein [Pseudomonadota bacterium]